MYVINNPSQFRDKITNKLNIIINNKRISKNLEISIFNFTIDDCMNKDVLTNGDNSYLYKYILIDSKVFI